jgi:flagellar biogenesis protein FliO
MSNKPNLNLKGFQISVLTVALSLVVFGSWVVLRDAAMLGILYVIGGAGWVLVYLMTNQKVRKKLFANLFDEE